VAKLAGQGWIGASDTDTEGQWRWVTGPEAGTQFWQGTGSGSAVGGEYNNWASGEPNDASGEDYAHFLSDGNWNDYAFDNFAIDGYVVEYGGLTDESCVQLSDIKTVTIEDAEVVCTFDVDITKTDETCGNSGDGTASANINNGNETDTFTYEWTGPSGFTASTETISALEPGIYNVTVINQEGCIATSSTEIIESIEVAIDIPESSYVLAINEAITPIQPTEVPDGNTVFSITPELPTGLSLNTSTGEISGTPTVAQDATEYTLTGTTVTGCTDTAIFTMGTNTDPEIDPVADITENCPNTDAVVEVSISDNETAADDLILTASSSNSAVLNTFDITTTGATRTVTMTPEADQTGTVTVTLSLEDEFGAIVQSSFDVTFIETSPVAVTQNITVQLDESGQVSVDPTSVDNGSYNFIEDLNDSNSFQFYLNTSGNIGVSKIDNNSFNFTYYTSFNRAKFNIVSTSPQNQSIKIGDPVYFKYTGHQSGTQVTQDMRLYESGFFWISGSNNYNESNSTFVIEQDGLVAGDTFDPTKPFYVKNLASGNYMSEIGNCCGSNTGITSTASLENAVPYTLRFATDPELDCLVTLDYSLDTTDFDCTNVGVNTVTLTVTDVNGNDTTAQIDNGSTDNCSIESFTLDVTEFDCSNVGANTVTLTVTDVNGNESSETATVNVEDNTDPTVLTQDITVELDENGEASITADQIDNGSTNNCNIESLALDVTEFDCTNVGVNTVTLTVTDVKNLQKQRQ